MATQPVEDEVLDALSDLEVALRKNMENAKLMHNRARSIRKARERGLSYRDIVSEVERPLIVEMLRANQDRLNSSGKQFRRAEAKALRAEGLTFDQIAAIFGVTRQRVIALVKDEAPADLATGANQGRDGAGR